MKVIKSSVTIPVAIALKKTPQAVTRSAAPNIVSDPSLRSLAGYQPMYTGVEHKRGVLVREGNENLFVSTAPLFTNLSMNGLYTHSYVATTPAEMQIMELENQWFETPKGREFSKEAEYSFILMMQVYTRTEQNGNDM
jgi:hypothetical protein